LVKELANAFCIALLLTGNVAATEAALFDGIAAFELDRISGDSLLIATAKSALRRRIGILEQSEGLSILPLELRRVFLLAPTYRDCFVLRALVGLNPGRRCNIGCASLVSPNTESFVPNLIGIMAHQIWSLRATSKITVG